MTVLYTTGMIYIGYLTTIVMEMRWCCRLEVRVILLADVTVELLTGLLMDAHLVSKQSGGKSVMNLVKIVQRNHILFNKCKK